MTDHGDDAHGWVLLLAQLPASPSSPRVTVWRRARSAGAIGVQNGAWVLPDGPAHVQFFSGLATYVREHGGSAFALRTASATGAEDDEIVARFRSDRAKEYAELTERGEELLAELAKETDRSNFTFAELEENEQDLERLASWLEKITVRDFFPDDHAKDAAALLDRCRRALEAFTAEVYRAEGIEPGGSDRP
ncbi:MAG: chromate resistance protein ChrB [Actinomycetota bacterium]|nr:chromate resistance protein ChrB [Actinomycetota bacterium]